MLIDPSGNKKVTGAIGSGDFLFFKVVKSLGENQYLLIHQGKEQVIYSSKNLSVGRGLWLKTSWNPERGLLEVVALRAKPLKSNLTESSISSDSVFQGSLRNRLNSLSLLFWRSYCLSKQHQKEGWEEWEILSLKEYPLWGILDKQLLLPLKLLSGNQEQESLLYSDKLEKELTVFHLEIKGESRDWLFKLMGKGGKWRIEVLADPIPLNPKEEERWISLCIQWKDRGIYGDPRIKLLKEELILSDLIREGISSLDFLV